jgi:hypothetical protein
MLDTEGARGNNLHCGIGSPANHGSRKVSIWDVLRRHFVCAWSMIRFCRLRNRPTLIGSQVSNFMDSCIRRVGLCL